MMERNNWANVWMIASIFTTSQTRDVYLNDDVFVRQIISFTQLFSKTQCDVCLRWISTAAVRVQLWWQKKTLLISTIASDYLVNVWHFMRRKGFIQINIKYIYVYSSTFYKWKNTLQDRQLNCFFTTGKNKKRTHAQIIIKSGNDHAENRY